jgi:hypothetical protein
VATRSWEQLRNFLKTATWGELEFVRFGLSARAAREQGDQLESESAWNNAVKKASANPESMLVLAETAHGWGWQAEAIDLLWLAAKDPVGGEEALRRLYSYFSKNRDTPNIYRALLRLEQFRARDLNIQNNLAQLSLLLNLNVERAQRQARDLYEKEPANPAYVSTYAFALFSKGDNKKAVEVLSALSPEDLRKPEVAAYYGICLAAAGDRARAIEFLDLAKSAALLPEEAALVEKTRRSLTGS